MMHPDPIRLHDPVSGTGPPPLARDIELKKPRRDDGSSSFSDDSSSDENWDFEPTVHNLYEKSTEQDSDTEATQKTTEPSVVFVAAVFKATSDGEESDSPEESRRRKYNTPIAIYRDRSPLSADRKSIHYWEEESSGDESDDQNPEEWRPSWSGCVFEVTCTAIAQFSWASGASTEGADETYKSQKKRLETKHIDSLKLSRVSQQSIVIRSPFLYTKLATLAGYYPTFSEKSYRNLSSLKVTRAEDIRGRFRLPYSWGFLMHKFCDMERFLDTHEPASPKTSGSDFEASQSDAQRVEILGYQKGHVRELYQFLKPQYDRTVLPCIKELEQDSPRLPFEMLWYIFSPGTEVYVKAMGTYHACVIHKVWSNLEHSIRLGREEESDPYSDEGYARPVHGDIRHRTWSIEVWYLDTDGQYIGRVYHTRQIQFYSGSRRLTQLDICPCTIWDKYDQGERRRMIMQRSELFFKCIKQGHMLAQYKGPVFGPVPGNLSSYSGQLVIDFKRGFTLTQSSPPALRRPTPGSQSAFFNKRQYDMIWVNDQGPGFIEMPLSSPNGQIPPPSGHRVGLSGPRPPDQMGPYGPYGAYVSEPSAMPMPGHRPPSPPGIRQLPVPFRGPDPITTPKGDGNELVTELSDQQLLLLFPVVQGFAIRTKQWMTIRPDDLVEAVHSQNSILNLVLEKTELKTLQSLSTRQKSNKQWAADFIEGKGTGQIILLHGPPGVGKTYTVEAIAELLNRPLLSLTVADIGIVEVEVERELMRWFSLAEIWDAVLLVDEADVFLERRQNRDLARNGLVTAFLRRMEYFKGLLFLTTNRVGQIDDAFISRIHIAIEYRPFTPEAHAQVWKGFFGKLARERAGRIQIAPAAKSWVLATATSGESQMNGRDIRNALQTAITLAEADYHEDPDFDPEKTTIIVDQSHFEKVLDFSNKFRTYVESIRREDERKRAAGRHDRNDYGIDPWGDS
ncbi:hypothetical protein F5Y15DRAFT_411360 [Xylariaceae sp. FL0016]|nr:hypothetical protein F5Y15DRAFT_411360 [Xylariaceae sp. FL0016]